MSQTNTQASARGKKRYGGLIFGLLMMAAAVWISLNQQLVLDQLVVWRYEPSAEVASYAERTTMTDSGKFYLYASQPSVETTQKFNSLCGRKEEGTAILGCYVSGRIYVYGVDDKRLDGIREITAAHEMLHAAYVRLRPTERAKLDRLIDQQYESIKATPAFAERMEFYARTEPGERNNELHSIFGTEFVDLSPELEKHYRQYFKDRQQLVALHAKYASVFDELKAEADQLLKTLNDLQAEISAESDSYNAGVKALNLVIEDFNRRAESGDFTSQAQFNRERASLLSRAAALERQRANVSSKLATHENLRKQYNETISRSQDLYESMDSNLAPAPTVQGESV